MPILEACEIYKTYSTGGNEFNAVDGISFSVEKGEFVSIMGPSGSGKTTLLNIIGCLDRASGGKMLVGGRDTSGLNDKELDHIRLKNIGFVFQRINLIPILTALENVELPMEMAGLEKNARRERAEELLKSVGLAKRTGHRPGQLSAGEQQRVGIARSLANNPEVLLADEPTGNLDSASAASIMSILSNLNRDKGQTLIIVTHDPEVGASASRQVNIRDGKIVA